MIRNWFRTLTPNGQVVAATTAVVIGMGSLGWASVPLYDLFCRVTGYGGTTALANGGTIEVLDQTIKVRFDASRAIDMPWTFKPLQRQMEIRLGETGLAFYEAHNPTDRPIAGTASYNVAPFAAGLYFTKIECFCFTEQVLMPGETVVMPVTFFVDPDMLGDVEARGIPEITLSYTFHVTDLPEEFAGVTTFTPKTQTN
jgi:cytochrome c oxidase assembly protein subunit 11